MAKLENLLLTIWVGGMLAIGYIAAPVLFSMLDDRSLAGALAGEMFSIIALIGLVAGGVLLLFYLLRESLAGFRQWRFWVLLLMVSLVCVSQFVLQPMMAELKAQGLEAGSEASRSFGKLHGVSSILYLLTSIGGLILVVAGMRSTGGKRSRSSDVVGGRL